MSTTQRCPEDQKVCVRNLPRDCTESELRELFTASCGTIIDLFLRSGDRDTYAFVGFDKREGRDEALKLNDTDFKGSTIKVEEKGGRRNDRGGDSRGAGGRDQNKIFVRGINADTTDEDIKDFFGKVGKIVDYYRKPDANFCFIGFEATSERDEALRLAGKDIGNSRIHVEPKGGNSDRHNDRRHNDRFHNDRRHNNDRRDHRDRRDSRDRRSRSRGRREDSRDGKRRRRSRS